MPDLGQAAGAVLMVGGVALTGFVLLAELADAKPSNWYERRPVLVAAALACLVVGGLLVAR